MVLDLHFDNKVVVFIPLRRVNDVFQHLLEVNSVAVEHAVFVDKDYVVEDNVVGDPDGISLSEVQEHVPYSFRAQALGLQRKLHQRLAEVVRVLGLKSQYDSVPYV